MAHKGHAANKKDALQTKNDRCKQKRCAANKKRSLQTKKMRYKQKRCAANKKRSLQTKKKNRCNSHHARAPCVGVIWFYAPVGSRTFPRNVLFMFSMFCSRCGSQLAKAAKFCQVCGITISVKEEDLSCVAQLEVEPSERKRHQTALLTFEEYRERKGKERTSRFVSKSSKKAKKESGENEVSIHIGFIRLKDGELKVIRGSSLPLKVLPSIGAEELLRKGAEKMVKFNSDLSLYEPSNFTLLYPDKTEVKYLPGGTEPFTLQRYRCRVNGSVPLAGLPCNDTVAE